MVQLLSIAKKHYMSFYNAIHDNLTMNTKMIDYLSNFKDQHFLKFLLFLQRSTEKCADLFSQEFNRTNT